jgi:hypothetical protein
MSLQRFAARSQTALIHAARAFPAFSAAASQRSLRSLDSLSSYRSSSGLSTGGLPLGRFVFSIGLIMPVHKSVDKLFNALYSVRTVNQRTGEET